MNKKCEKWRKTNMDPETNEKLTKNSQRYKEIKKECDAVPFTNKECAILKKQNINPRTGRKLQPYSAKLKSLRNECETISESLCVLWEKDKTVNPRTNRKISKTGKIYKKYEEQCSRYSKEQCINDVDPITLEPFDTFTADDIIKIGRHCFSVLSLFDYYVNKIKNREPITNPFIPNSRLTPAQISELKTKIKKLQPNIRMPRPVRYRIPRGMSLDIHRYGLFYKLVLRHGTNYYTLGFIPSNIDPETSGSTDLTSAVILTKIRRLWYLGRFLISARTRPVQCCKIHLHTDINFWNDNVMEKFIALSNEIDDLL